jgi:oleandomycin transport system ATP-binding protein
MVGGFDVVRQAPQVRRLIGLTGQQASVDDELTGLGNLVLLGQLLDLRRADAHRRAVELLERFQLDDAAAQRVATYSGGMRRRLDLAASLIGRPRVIFLDEPSAGLDPGRRRHLWRMIRELTNEGAAVVLTTQYLEEADVLADDISVIDHGRVIADGTPAELKQIVGGHTIAVRPDDLDRIDEVESLMALVAGRRPERVSRHEVVVPVHGDGAVLDLTRRFHEHRITVTEISLRLPSLDEAFLVLTGAPRDPVDHHDDTKAPT